jgi:hypothetical protein
MTGIQENDYQEWLEDTVWHPIWIAIGGPRMGTVLSPLRYALQSPVGKAASLLLRVRVAEHVGVPAENSIKLSTKDSIWKALEDGQ